MAVCCDELVNIGAEVPDRPTETDEHWTSPLMSPCSKCSNLQSQTPGRFDLGERFGGGR